MHIAAVPLAEKQEVLDAQQEYSVAKMERAKAESDYGESGTDLKVAKNEREQALLAERSASSKKQAAKESNDLNRINAATAEARAAELTRKAADEKVTWLRAHRKYLKKQVRFAEEEMYAKEAKYELAKAKLARAKNIRPRGFDYGAFEKQAQERSQRAQRARALAQREKSRSDQRKRRYDELTKAAQAMGGGPPPPTTN